MFPVEPTIVEAGQFVLYYPASAPTNVLVLRSPDLGNTSNVQVMRTFNNTKGGQLAAFRDEQWPKNRVFNYTFQGLAALTRASFIEFILLSLGKRIKIIDHETQTMYGYILTPEATISQTLRGCGHTVELNFQEET